MADVQPLVEAVRPGRLAAELGPPIAGDRQQPRIQRLLELLDRLRVGSAEIAVLTGSVATGSHIDGGAEQFVFGEELAQPPRLGGREEPGKEGAAFVADSGGDRGPV